MVKPRENRVPIMMSDEELKAIDDWRFDNRVATRSEAIRRLCKISLLVERELEGIVDYATDSVRHLNEGLGDAMEIRGTIDSAGAEGLHFDIDEMRDVLRAYSESASNAVDTALGVQELIVTLYNAIVPIAQEPTISGGVAQSEKTIQEAQAVVADAIAKQKERADHKYLLLLYNSETPEERAAYEALPEDQKDAALDKKIAALELEEKTDPDAFYDKYDLWPFWAKPGWKTRLRARLEGTSEEPEE